MLIINGDEVREILVEDNCRDIMEETLKLIAQRGVQQNLRQAIPLGDYNVFGLMPCAIETKNVFGAKMISVFPQNTKIKLPSHQGAIVLFNYSNGVMEAVVDAEAITAVRTAAVSAVATKFLARKEAKVLTILGAGLQGRQHVRALLKVRCFEKIHLWDCNGSYAKEVAKNLSKELNRVVEGFDSAENAVRDADVICTVTTLREPIIQRSWLKSGVHINAVGACTPDAREIDSLTMKDAVIFSDSMESILNESGDYLIPLKEGVISSDDIRGEIGEVIAGSKTGRKTDEEITLFESLGLASEDIMAAHYVYEVVKNKIGG